jgi:hypothetical protein
MICFDFYVTIIDHIVGHLEIIIQVRFLCPLDPLYIINLNLKKKYRKRKMNKKFDFKKLYIFILLIIKQETFSYCLWDFLNFDCI